MRGHDRVVHAPIAAALFAAFGVAACQGPVAPMWPVGPIDQLYRAEAPFAYELDAAGARALSVEGINGPVAVRSAAEAETIQVIGLRSVASSSQQDADAHLQDVEVFVDLLGDEVVVRTEHPLRADGRSYSVEYEIVVPARLAVNVEIDNGRIDAWGLRASLTAQTTNGNIDAEVAMPSGGTVALTTTNGEIDLALPTATSAQLWAETVNGTVEVSGLELEELNRTDHRLEAVLGSGEGDISLDAINGTISLQGL